MTEPDDHLAKMEEEWSMLAGKLHKRHTGLLLLTLKRAECSRNGVAGAD